MDVYIRVCVHCTLHAFMEACLISMLPHLLSRLCKMRGGPSFLMLLGNLFPPPSWEWEPPKFSSLEAQKEAGIQNNRIIIRITANTY